MIDASRHWEYSGDQNSPKSLPTWDLPSRADGVGERRVINKTSKYNV